MVDAAAVERFAARERERFLATQALSAELASATRRHWLDGVPMHWMADWGTPHPLFVAAAEAATLTLADGQVLDDFCLGDTGAMYGHSPPAIAAAIAAQAAQGLTCMLSSTLAAEVGERLAALFGLPYWQLAQTASEANRSALRWARAITGRRRTLVFHGCYHGTVDETLVRLRDGRTVAREGGVGTPFDNAAHTVAVEFNDPAALERALAAGDVAAVLAEPTMTNVGMVLPQPGFLETLRAATRRHGTLLVIDETHTLSAGCGGQARGAGLAPDLLTCGKAIAGGLPCAVWGFTAEVERAMRAFRSRHAGGHSGMGTTLAGNPLALAALRAALAHLVTPANHARMDALAARLAAGLAATFAARHLPWQVTRVGARVEFAFGPAPRNGSEAEAAMQPALEAALHLGLLNRGVLVTPFHNMMLCSPVTTEAQVDRLIAALGACLDSIAGIDLSGGAAS